ncbi:MAG: AAA family ATPase [Gammaproteobacteria bacterium]|nr:AAA family ATPase [Gammaproteobacteria bacterium]
MRSARKQEVESQYPPIGITEAVDEFAKRVINHEALSRAYRKARSALSSSGGPRVVMIAGPTGVGKTTLAQALRRHAMERYAKEIIADPSCVPVIYGNAIPPNGASFSWKDFYIRLLERHGDVLTNRKLLVPRQSEIFPELPAPSPLERSVTDALRRAVENCMRLRKTRVLIIDEAHHLLMVNDPRRLEFQFEALKSLTIETDAVIVLLGTYRLLEIRDQSGQLVRRSEIIHFPRYDIRVQQDIEAFASVLETFQSQLPLKRTPNFLADAEYFYLKTGGCVGILKDWLTRCLEQALIEGRKTIDREFAERYSLSNKSLKTIIEEAMNGEEKLSDVGVEKVEKLLKEGVPTEDDVATPSSTRKTGNKGRRVGERLPVRDPVGGAYVAP